MPRYNEDEAENIRQDEDHPHHYESPLSQATAVMGPVPQIKFSFDRTSSGHERLTCRCGKATVRQPYMNLDQWLAAVRSFTIHIKQCNTPV